MSDRIAVATVDEFENRDRMIVDVDGIEVGVFNIDGTFHAVLNSCPHQNGPVAEGAIGPKVTADLPELGQRPTEYYDHSTTVLRCPHHSWGFDIATGEHIGSQDPSHHLVTYDTIVEDGTVYLNI